MSGNKYILLVEDNRDDEQLTLRALRKHNVANEVVVAGNGQFAMDYLFGRGEHESNLERPLPAVVVLDLSLPDMGGIDVLREIRSEESTRLVPVVVLTAHNDPNAIREAYRWGANSFVAKPTSPDDFAESILNIVMYWLLLNQAA